MKSKFPIHAIFVALLIFVSSITISQVSFVSPRLQPDGTDIPALNPAADKLVSDLRSTGAEATNDHAGFTEEDPNTAHYLPFSGTCYPGTGNRFTGSWHSNLYIGNNNGANVLMAWGQLMLNYTATGTGNITAPTTVSAATYSGVPLEVKSCSSGGATGESVLVLRTSTNLYVFGTAVNLTAITTMAGFGGIAINTAASNISGAKLPAGVLVTDINQVEISRKALAIVTNAGHVYMLTTLVNMQGDKTAATPAVWHHVTLADGVTFLSGVTKFSLSGSGAFALVESTNKIYYWGAPANVAGVANTTTSYNYAFDMSAQIPATTIVKNLVCLGTSTPSSSTLFLLCNDRKVYSCGLNTGGCLGINNATVTFNQPTFIAVKGTDGVTDLANIMKIDGDTEGDVFCIAAMTYSRLVYGWGDSPAGMLGVNGATGSFAVPKTVQLFTGTAPGSGYSDFSVSGHFIIAFYVNGVNDQYWYLGHNIGGSFGDPANATTFILAATPANLNAPVGVSFNCSSPFLPITWLSFNAQKQAGNVSLTWSTGTEINSQDFLVEHSTDGNNWTIIGTVQAAGISNNTENYYYLHTRPAMGINYYRLLQRDIDDRSSYSKTISILFNNKTKQLIISANNVVNGVLDLQLPEAASITIFNSTGQLMLSKELAAGKQQVPVGNFAKGVYMLKSGEVTEKFNIR